MSVATRLSRCEHLGSLVITEHYCDKHFNSYKRKQTINLNSCHIKFNILKIEANDDIILPINILIFFTGVDNKTSRQIEFLTDSRILRIDYKVTVLFRDC